MAKTIILITGATGKQGGVVARRLLSGGEKVRVLTRTPSKAEPLARMGAEVVQGDMTDRAALEKALSGVAGVFAMTTPFEAGMDTEVRQGITLADTAKGAGVSRYVFTSVGSANRNTGIPHFETKWKVEQHIKKIGLPATILRPVFFMENFVSPWFWLSISQGKLIMPLRPSTRLQMIALDDIGAFGAAAFKEKNFVGQEIDLAGDEMTMPQVAEILSRVLNRKIVFEPLSEERAEAATGRDFALMFKWFNEVGYNVDIAGLERRWGIPLNRFEQVARKMEWPKGE